METEIIIDPDGVLRNRTTYGVASIEQGSDQKTVHAIEKRKKKKKKKRRSVRWALDRRNPSKRQSSATCFTRPSEPLVLSSFRVNAQRL